MRIGKQSRVGIRSGQNAPPKHPSLLDHGYDESKPKSEWDIEDMRKKINDRTKAIVIINPNNPTGALYPKEVLQQIVDLAREHQLIISLMRFMTVLLWMERACFYCFSRTGSVLRDIQRTVQVPYDRRIPYRMDDLKWK